jgi:hypothetical protein
MNYCSACGREIGEGSAFCQYCGVKAGEGAAPDPFGRDTVTEAEFATFIGRNSGAYLSRFRRFSVLGHDNFTPTWNWAAFFFGPFWMFYRKMYMWAVIALLVHFIPWVNFLFWIGWGIVGYYLYYKHAKNKILEFKAAAAPSGDIGPVLAEVGGVHGWLMKAYTILWIIAALGILAAIAITGYVGYKAGTLEVEAVGVKARSAFAQDVVTERGVTRHNPDGRG